MVEPAALVRARLLDALEADLVWPFLSKGVPGAGQEVLPLPPSRWYLTGFLAPQLGRVPDPEEDESEGELAAGSESQAEDAGSDEPEAKRRQHFPASMGLSVFLPPAQGSGPDHVEVEVRWADYERVELAEDRSDKLRIGWKRVPRGPYTVQVPLDAKRLAAAGGVRWPESTQLCFRGELRTTDLDGLLPGTRVLSLFLLNDRVALEKDRDLNFAFQVGFRLRYARGFEPRPNRRGEGAQDQDPRVLALMFRDHTEWAVGHNTSVKLPQPDADGRVRELSTTQLPCYEVRGVEHESIAGIETGITGSECTGSGRSTALQSPTVTDQTPADWSFFSSVCSRNACSAVVQAPRDTDRSPVSLGVGRKAWLVGLPA